MDFEEFKKTYQKVEVEHYTNSIPENVTVSVLVQTYNHENFLKQCLDSILDQKTSFNFEIILGEDCSGDKTRDYCIEYAKKYPNKIRLFLHKPENKIFVEGVKTGNFNAFYNLFNARGKYIAFCEGDDYWGDPYKLEKQIQFLNNNLEYSFSYHRFEEIFNSKVESKQLLDQPTTDASRQELIFSKVHPLLSTLCFRKCLQEFPSQAFEVINVDTFIFSLLGNHGSAKFIQEIQPNFYRRHSGGIWTKNNKDIKLLTKSKTYEKLYEFYSEVGKKGDSR